VAIWSSVSVLAMFTFLVVLPIWMPSVPLAPSAVLADDCGPE